MLKDAEREGVCRAAACCRERRALCSRRTAASLPTQALDAIEPNQPATGSATAAHLTHHNPEALVGPARVHARRICGWRSHRLRVWTGVPRPRRRARGQGGSPGAGAAGVREHQGRTHGRGRQLHGPGEAHLLRARRSGRCRWFASIRDAFVDASRPPARYVRRGTAARDARSS